MPAAPDIGYAMSLPPAQAIQYFESLGNEITWDWRMTALAIEAQSFAVSNAARLDILADIKAAVLKQLTTGQTEATTIKELTAILQAKGWWGTQIAVDAEGNAQQIELGSPARLQTIVRTNTQSALNAGRYKDFMRGVSRQPYWQYIAVMDQRTRPAHAAMNGRIFRYDDPIWDTHWPPCGYNCRCRVRALSDKDVQRGGYSIESSAGKMTTVDQSWGVDQRTGEIITRPTQAITLTGVDGKPIVFAPDAGFGFNPGQGASWDPVGVAPDVPPDAPPPADAGTPITIMPDQPSWEDAGQPDIRNVAQSDVQPAQELLPKAANADEALVSLADALGISEEVPAVMVTTPVGDIGIQFEQLSRLVDDRIAAIERYANLVLPALKSPFEVWLTTYSDGSIRPRFFGVFADGSVVVVRVNLDGTIVWQVMSADAANANRTGDLAYPILSTS